MTNLLAFIPVPPFSGFDVGPLRLHVYGILIAAGIVAALLLASYRWRKAGGNPADLEVPGLWGVVAGFVGARIAYVSTHTQEFAGDWVKVLAIWEGGIALYGGLTLGLTTGMLVAWRRGLPVWRAMDAAIVGIPLAQAIGRWGNYFNQELFGTPSTLPWAVQIEPQHRPLDFIQFETFHPTFLYESLIDFAIVGLLLFLSARRSLRPGSLVLCYLLTYGTGRFGMELLRTDTTFRFWGLSRNAWVSVLVVAGAAILLFLRERYILGKDDGGEEEPAAATPDDGDKPGSEQLVPAGAGSTTAPAEGGATAEQPEAAKAESGEPAGAGRAEAAGQPAEEPAGRPEPARAEAGPKEPAPEAERSEPGQAEARARESGERQPEAESEAAAKAEEPATEEDEPAGKPRSS